MSPMRQLRLGDHYWYTIYPLETLFHQIFG